MRSNLDHERFKKRQGGFRWVLFCQEAGNVGWNLEIKYRLENLIFEDTCDGKCDTNIHYQRDVFKNPSYGKIPLWGEGVPPFSVNFFPLTF